MTQAFLNKAGLDIQQIGLTLPQIITPVREEQIEAIMEFMKYGWTLCWSITRRKEIVKMINIDVPMINQRVDVTTFQTCG